ncbi:MAG: DUF1850 domain-containing protein [Defluviitaleaceae bacterium]|nr:DUF1850 domain-containing protein [Defluviitaleaceae bacterium]
MPKKRGQIILAGVVVSALAILIFTAFLTRGYCLTLRNDQTGALLLSRHINDGDVFSVGYIHSVNKSPVTEIYQIRQGKLTLIAVEFETFGAGMPTEPEHGQTLIYLPGGGMRIEGFDRAMDDLRYIIGYTTNHTLALGAEQIALDALDSAGQTIRFSVIRKSFSLTRKTGNFIRD